MLLGLTFQSDENCLMVPLLMSYHVFHGKFVKYSHNLETRDQVLCVVDWTRNISKWQGAYRIH